MGVDMAALDMAALSERFGLRVQPMVHVAEMGRALDFYGLLGGRIVFGSRDGDWALVAFGETTLSLLARPPGDGATESVELQFICAGGLEAIEAHVRGVDTGLIERGTADEMFGRMLKLRAPDGLLVKILEVERELIG